MSSVVRDITNKEERDWISQRMHRISSVSMEGIKHGSTLVDGHHSFYPMTSPSEYSFFEVDRKLWTDKLHVFESRRGVWENVTSLSSSNVVRCTYRVAEKSIDREENAESSPYPVQTQWSSIGHRCTDFVEYSHLTGGCQAQRTRVPFADVIWHRLSSLAWNGTRRSESVFHANGRNSRHRR